ncbi:hypothetical protein MDMS009_165 [Methylophaga thiooxydans DMS010]|uniref:Uncharacterized protein n=1 Tax=Methylophaga thiooxydans DMS010 TaxID=637616 RepID=C0N1Y1_9GAMM|nr:hypothetical protein MDMS009_165 [Methylophaga thiooxydans DMS010]
MEVTSSLNNSTLNKTIFRIVGSVLFSQKQTIRLFLSHLQRLSDALVFSSQELKGRQILFIMRPAASLTGC